MNCIPHIINLDGERGGADVIAIGKFESIHKGHAELIKKYSSVSKVGALIFYPSPRKVFGEDVKSIYTLKDRILMLQKLGVSKVYIQPFSKCFYTMESEDFASRYLSFFGGARVVVGEDFKFGKNRRGDITMLQDVYQNVDIVSKVVLGNDKVGYDNICNALRKSNFVQFKEFTSRHFHYSGRVVKGMGQASSVLKFPTVNISIPQNLFRLKYGVYCVNIHIGRKVHCGVANFGVKPTYGVIKETLEVHVLEDGFDFPKRDWNNYKKVEFLHFIRGEQKFDGLDALKSQISTDAQYARDFFSKI